jgi:peptidoglycan/LPS O-acetylase OafA/YrhL
MSVTVSAIPRSGGERIESVDALRGIAALYVLFYHLALIPTPHLSVPHWAGKYVLTGGTGVTLFFVVSAFCLCLSMRTHQDETSPVVRFYLRRIFRVVPLFYVWLVMSWIRDWLAYGVYHPWWEVLLNASFSFNFVPGKNEGFVWAGWTLGVEMVFYLLFPLIFRYAGTLLKSLLFFVASLGVALAFTGLSASLPIPDAARESFLRTNLLVQMPVFALGIVAYFVYERFIRGKNRSQAWAFLLSGTAIFVYDRLISGKMPPTLGYILSGNHGQGLIYSVLLTGLTVAPIGLLVNPVSRFYGKISYSVYLNHPTFVFLLTPVYRVIYSIHMRPTFQYGLCLLLTLTLVTFVAYGTYRVIESPGIRLGSRLVKRIGNRRLAYCPAPD